MDYRDIVNALPLVVCVGVPLYFAIWAFSPNKTKGN